MLTLGAGCASTDYIAFRETPFNPLAVPLQLLSHKGPQPTPRTAQLLRRFDLAEEDASTTLERLQSEITQNPTADKLYSYAELAYIDAKRADAKGNQQRALELYGSAAAHAYWYLFDPRYDSFRNPYDPQFRGACDVYNAALEGALRVAHRQDQLHPGGSYTIRTGEQQFEVKVVAHGNWHDEDFERLEFVSDYEIKGLSTRHHNYGLGVPLIAVRRAHEGEEATEQYYPPGLSFAATAFLRVSTRAGQGRGAAHQCVLELHDPLHAKDIVVAHRLVPLETDLTTPLAFFLDNPAFEERKNIATLALLNPATAESIRGLFMLEPYDPNKIPVVMVHGLWSSPVTWMEMFNQLRSFPEIRNQYQFWFYLYPTGQPFWISAPQMREHLAEMRRNVDPRGSTTALDQMVLVGHSMGGLVSKLQTLESGDDFWRVLSDKQFDELEADEETRENLAKTVFFRPNPSIRRVITIATPHRGSDYANDYTRWLARKLIALPDMMISTSRRLTRENPGFFRNTELLTISTSVDSLSPDSPILPVMLRSRRSPWVKYHNIVGLVRDEGLFSSFSAGSDGIVNYDSAHLDDVASEITVEADHMNVHRHARAILEVRRILLEHQQVALAEMRRESEAIPASFGRWQQPTR
jgi:pimeloyl-ACP methyl ester carboxylesterase